MTPAEVRGHPHSSAEHVRADPVGLPQYDPDQFDSDGNLL